MVPGNRAKNYNATFFEKGCSRLTLNLLAILIRLFLRLHVLYALLHSRFLILNLHYNSHSLPALLLYDNCLIGCIKT